MGAIKTLKAEAEAFFDETGKRYPGENPSPLRRTEQPGLVCVDIDDLLRKELPPREILLDPWLTKQSLFMIYAWRGLGKSWLALSLGYALACGGEVLGWKANGQRKVLYLDGELPATTLQSRLSMIVSSFEEEADPNNFKIITPDLQPNGAMPNLSLPAGQEIIDKYAGDCDVIIVDNLSTLCRSGKENEGESWLPVQEWALRHRSGGRSVGFIHHAGKGGAQRGTSRKEDVLDTVISLKRPPDYETNAGAKFELHFEKCRNLSGNHAQTLEVELKSFGNRIVWNYKTAELAVIDRIEALAKDGATRSEIIEETGLSRFSLNRQLAKANETGRRITIKDSRKKGGSE